MAVTVTGATFQSRLAGTVNSGTGATHQFSKIFDASLQSSGAYLYDRAWVLENYSLTTGAGDLDLDLYDLGGATPNVGAGAAEDNLGLTQANARIVAIGIRNKEVSGGGTLRIDQNGASTTAWTGLFHGSTVLDLAQGSFISAYLGTAGKTVTDTTDHVLRLSAQTNDCTIDVVFYAKQS